MGEEFVFFIRGCALRTRERVKYFVYVSFFFFFFLKKMVEWVEKKNVK